MSKSGKWFPRTGAGYFNFAGAFDRAQQQFQADCDVNTIARRLAAGEDVAPLHGVGRYADFASVPDFHAAMNLVARAQEQFNQLPGEVRQKFGNDPGQLLAFVRDANNWEAARDLGLLSEEAVARGPRKAPAPPAPPAPTTTTDKA